MRGAKADGSPPRRSPPVKKSNIPHRRLWLGLLFSTSMLFYPFLALADVSSARTCSQRLYVRTAACAQNINVPWIWYLTPQSRSLKLVVVWWPAVELVFVGCALPKPAFRLARPCVEASARHEPLKPRCMGILYGEDD